MLVIEEIGMSLSDEHRIDAKLEEIDRLIEELQKRKHELLEAKEGSRAEKALPKKELLESSEMIGAEKPLEKTPRLSEFDKSAASLEETLNSLEWKGFKKKEGEWTFLRDRDGRLRDELVSMKDFVEGLRTGKAVMVGKYSYRVSEDRFLNRFLVDPKAV